MSEETRPPSDIEAMMRLITQQYGTRLTPAELQEVRQGVEGLAQVTAALRQVPLSNSDEPLAVFVPYRQEGAAHES
jgi:hypothetical protein